KHVTSSKQSIIQSTSKDCDIFALYHEGKHHIIAELIFREGKLIGADNYKFIELASTDQDIWESFLLQHYQDKEERPPEVLLPISLKNKDILEEILHITFIQPKKGEKHHLIELALKNAKSLFD